MSSRKYIDITGMRFGRLVAMHELGFTNSGRPKWKCICDCGNFTISRKCSLRDGTSQSCGCLRRERSIASQKARAEYLWKKPVYRVWNGMKERCTNPNCSSYHRYGGRGITVCDRWMKFKPFYEDMGDPPFKGASLGRINNDGNYEPGNVRWETRETQSRNTCTNRFISFNGESLCIQDWSKRLGIKRLTLHSRLLSGWSIEKAFTTPVDPKGGQFKVGHKKLSRKTRK